MPAPLHIHIHELPRGDKPPAWSWSLSTAEPVNKLLAGGRVDNLGEAAIHVMAAAIRARPDMAPADEPEPPRAMTWECEFGPETCHCQDANAAAACIWLLPGSVQL